MRKALAVFVALAAFLAVFACGRRETSPPTPAPAPELAAPASPAPTPSFTPRIERYTGASPQLATRFVHLSGTSGTVIVPANEFVTSIYAYSRLDAGSMTIAPTGPHLQTPCATWDAGPDPYDAHLPDGALFDAGPDLYDGAPPPTCGDGGPAIIIPAGSGYKIEIPVIVGAQDEIGPGSVLVFTGTDSYVLTLTYYGP